MGFDEQNFYQHLCLVIRLQKLLHISVRKYLTEQLFKIMNDIKT